MKMLFHVNYLLKDSTFSTFLPPPPLQNKNKHNFVALKRSNENLNKIFTMIISVLKKYVCLVRSNTQLYLLPITFRELVFLAGFTLSGLENFRGQGT